VQALQVLTVLIAAPGINGVISRVEARLQGRRGPRVLQPYFDIAKLFRGRPWRRWVPAGSSSPHR
jgi:formate hydrogenlyase subunit 4